MEETKKIDKTHQCKFNLYSPPKDIFNLGFINLLSANMSGADCYKCSLKQCSFHTGSSKACTEPVLCNILYPTSSLQYSSAVMSNYKPLKESENEVALDKEYCLFLLLRCLLRRFLLLFLLFLLLLIGLIGQ
jgi:hypothetical protein